MLLDLIMRKLKIQVKNEDERTLKVRKNIVYTFIIKGCSVLIGFLLVPLIIQYLNPAQYGIWVMISSLISWINTFDIGLSNGLRNKLAYSVAINNKKDVIKYTSTTYFLLFFIAATIFAGLWMTRSVVNWNKVFNVQNTVRDINPIFLITIAGFCIQFVLQPINNILIALHQPFKVSLLLLINQGLTIITIYILKLFTTGNLYNVILVTTGSPLLVWFFSSLYLYRNDLKDFAPRLSKVDVSIAKDLLTISASFFFIQIGAIILYETDNIIIARTLSPAEVTTFNVAYKYFFITVIAFSIIITPYWSAFTDAFAKKDYEWMARSIKKMRLLWLILAVVCFILYLIADIVYRAWVGDNIHVPRLLSFLLALNMILQNWMNISAFMLNGVGKLKVQLILILITSAANIPLSVLLIHKIGIAGTVLANVIVFLILSVFFTYQCKLILNKKAYGVWDK